MNRRPRQPIRSSNGMVAAGHPLATTAGLSILRAGGNAVDAAVAAATVSAVVLPNRCGLGGDAFALVYDRATGVVEAINGSGAAPAGLPMGAFASGFPDGGAQLATVPGAVSAIGSLAESHGSLDLCVLMRDAIDHAENGFPITNRLAAGISSDRDRLDADHDARAVFGTDRPPPAGSTLRQPALASTLRRIAQEGATDFYSGELAGAIAAGVQSRGGWIAEDDLRVHQTQRSPALAVSYRDCTFYGQPPVSQGHVLMESLAIADGAALSAIAWGGAELIHTMVQIKRMAFADRNRYAGDPTWVQFDVEGLITGPMVGERQRELAALRAATGHDTTYIAVVDGDGNACSLILSIFHSFGSGTMIPGTGIVLNDRMTGFSLDPLSPNAMQPGKRPMHTLNAVIATRDSRLWAVFGTPGAHAQVQTNFQLAVAMTDFGFDVARAIDEPRWFDDEGTLYLEEGLSSARAELERVGYKVEMLPDWPSEKTGGAQAIEVSPDGSLAGAADLRREGQAAGF